MAAKFPLEIVISAIDKFTQPLATASAKLDRFGKNLESKGRSLSLGLSLPLATAALYAVKASAQMEQLTTRFETLTGSAMQAQKIMTDLKELTLKTPFQITEVGDSAAMLFAAGFSVQNLNKHMQTLVDVASGAKQPLSEITPIFARIALRGKAMTRDLNQFGTRGIPLVKELATELGKTPAKIYKMAQHSKISFALVQNALEKMTGAGGLYFNAAIKQSETLAGKFTDLQHAILITSAQIGDNIVKVLDLKNVIDRLIVGITDLGNKFTALDPATKKFLVFATIAAIVLGPVLIAIGLMATGLALVLTPIGAITVGLIAVGGLFGWLILQAGSVGKAFEAAFLGIATLIEDALFWPIRKLMSYVVDLMQLLHIGNNGGFAGKMKDALSAGSKWRAGDISFNALAQNDGSLAATDPDANMGISTKAANTGIISAAQNKQQRSYAKIEVVLPNTPQGSRVFTSTKGNTDISVDQGISMATP